MYVQCHSTRIRLLLLLILYSMYNVLGIIALWGVHIKQERSRSARLRSNARVCEPYSLAMNPVGWHAASRASQTRAA